MPLKSCRQLFYRTPTVTQVDVKNRKAIPKANFKTQRDGIKVCLANKKRFDRPSMNKILLLKELLQMLI